MLHSLSEQISHYSAYIQSQPDWEYAGVYADEAYTGTKGERPGFRQMLLACRAGKSRHDSDQVHQPVCAQHGDHA